MNAKEILYIFEETDALRQGRVLGMNGNAPVGVVADDLDGLAEFFSDEIEVFDEVSAGGKAHHEPVMQRA